MADCTATEKRKWNPPPIEAGDIFRLVIKKSNYPSDMILGDYYETDIVTRLDGTPITAYNVGGTTYILVKQMTEMGYAVDWNETERRVTVTSPALTDAPNE